MSLHDWKASPNRAGFAYRRSSTIRSATSSITGSTIWVSRRSKTLLGLFGYSACASAPLRTRQSPSPIESQPPSPSPTSHRSASRVTALNLIDDQLKLGRLLDRQIRRL